MYISVYILREQTTTWYAEWTGNLFYNVELFFTTRIYFIKTSSAVPYAYFIILGPPGILVYDSCILPIDIMLIKKLPMLLHSYLCCRLFQITFFDQLMSFKMADEISRNYAVHGVFTSRATSRPRCKHTNRGLFY